MPPMPEGVEDGIIRGLYKYRSQEVENARGRIQLFGSGPILREALRAQEVLAERYRVASDVWSVTSYKQLGFEAMEAGRWNALHPTEPPRDSYIEKCLKGTEGPYIAVSDYVRLVPEMIAPWIPGELITLGTDGFGRSESRQALRRFFEIDAESIVIASLGSLAKLGKIDRKEIQQAIEDLGMDPEKPAPWMV